MNGEARELPDGTSVADLISALGLTGARVAVERNRDLVRRAEHGTTRLSEGDQVEVVTLVGGG
ncbi:sulfur carrier protein ThiS [Planctomycetota bacterium]|nr:sulfur carrier protein ThiS [Planctomycetota bacterium]